MFVEVRLKLLRNLVQPDKPGDKSYEELTSALSKHYSPKPNVIVSRYKFNTAVRQPGQSIASYVAHLQQLSEHCNYGASLNDMLRDRLVCGVGDSAMQKRLFAEPDLKFPKAFDVCQAMESAERSTHDLQKGSASAIHKPVVVGSHQLQTATGWKYYKGKQPQKRYTRKASNTRNSVIGVWDNMIQMIVNLSRIIATIVQSRDT